MGSLIWEACLNALFLIILLMCFGRILDGITNMICLLLSSLLGSMFAYLVYNIGTFIGTIHHELSHAFLAFLTGAKITKLNLYKFDKTSNTLGSVEFITRGPVILQSIQLCLSAVAPVFVGFITLVGMLVYYSYGRIVGYYNILYWYVFVSILCHMRLSAQDIKMAVKGLPICYTILVILFYYMNWDLIGYVKGLV